MNISPAARSAIAAQLELRSRDVPRTLAPPDGILVHLAGRFPFAEWTTGRLLRSELRIPTDHFQLRIERLIPRFVRRSTRDDDEFSLTIPGLLVAGDAIEARSVMDSLFLAITRRAAADVDAVAYTSADLISAGIPEPAHCLAKNIARTCLLLGPGDEAEDLTRFRLPADTETMLESRLHVNNFERYLVRSATERVRNRHYSVKRPWLTAPFWLERDGSQPDYVPSNLIWGTGPVPVPQAELTPPTPVVEVPAPPSDVPLVPNYELLEPLGEGIGGRVYRAREARHGGIERAIKVFMPHPFSEEQDPAPRFRSETESLYRLQHRAVVRYVSAGLTSNTPPYFYLVMELVAGQSLRDRAPSMTVEDRVGVVIEILDGLQNVHASKIFHRDIKPTNIMLRASGQPVLVDFGLAYMLGEELDDDRTRGVPGTPGRIPPEVLNSPKSSRTPQHDIFQVAVTLYELLTNRLPRDPYQPLAADDPQLATLDPIVLRGLARDPKDRFANAAEFANQLSAWIATPRVSTEPDLPDFSGIAAMQAIHQVADMTETQQRRDRVDAATRVLAPHYETVRRRLVEISDLAKKQGVPVSVAAIVNDQPISELLSSLRSSRTSVDLFECEARPKRAERFVIRLSCEYRDLSPDQWPLRFVLTITPGPGYAGNDLVHLVAGPVLADWGREQAGAQFFPSLFAKWLNEPAHWSPDSAI